VQEVYYAIKGDSLQFRREGDNKNVIFWWERFRVSGRGTSICYMISEYSAYY
jgi:hypothetical protein